MTDLLNAIGNLPPPFLVAIVIVSIVFVTILASQIVEQLRLFADHEADRRLKRDLIESGLSADEARSVLAVDVAKRDAAA